MHFILPFLIGAEQVYTRDMKTNFVVTNLKLLPINGSLQIFPPGKARAGEAGTEK